MLASMPILVLLGTFLQMQLIVESLDTRDFVSHKFANHEAGRGSHGVVADIHADKKVKTVVGGQQKSDDADAADRAAIVGLSEAAQDLDLGERQDDTELKRIDRQIVALVRQRDAKRKDEKRKRLEVASLRAEISRLRGQLKAQSNNQAATQAQTHESDSSAAVSGEQVETAAAESQAATAAETSAQAEGEDQWAAEGSASAEQAASSAQAAEGIASTASAEETAGELEAVKEATVVAAKKVAHKHQMTAAEKAAQQAALQAKMEADAEAAMRAAAEKKAREKLDAEEAAKRAQEEASRKAAEEKQKKMDALADSADDSFKNFMKEEDGEDQQGDTDYEDSANALAGAIGWNRQEVESKADSAVKQLTEAIGGKKVIQSVQGMMAGVAR